MPRYRIKVEYDGTPFAGWQAQDNGRGVQAAIAQAVEKCSGERVVVYGAGRTDAGVHATGQVAHFDLDRSWRVDRLREALNHHLKPEPVAILDVIEADDQFHARFSATRRYYLYRIINRRPPLAIEAGRAWRVPVPLDAGAMNQAAQVLVGHHDFTTFRASGCQSASPVKTLDHLCVTRCGDIVEITCHSRSFLHSQVRSMAGSLREVGEGKWSAHDLRHALEARARTACGPVAPAHGLYLTQVDYH